MRILIFGASGFIGTHLVRHALESDVEVVAFSRSGGSHGEGVKWSLGDPVSEALCRDADCALHLAHDFNGEAGASLTIEATLSTIAALRALGVKRQLYFSSYSAGPHATSVYGRTKLAIEQALASAPDVVIVRPGLVLGEGGIYGRINGWVRKNWIVPLPDNGVGMVPVIEISRLCRESLNLASVAHVSRQANLFERAPVSLRQLVLSAAAKAGKRPLIVPVPSRLVLWGLRLAARLPIRLPVNEDNLAGFLANQTAQHISTLDNER